jgi:LPLT family lysophospholipid transporter-like MFS transporter
MVIRDIVSPSAKPLIFIHTITWTFVFLLLIGCLGGIYIVPMNACLQHVGHASVGAGKTIAVQNFVENTLMFASVGLYTFAAKVNAPLDLSIDDPLLFLLRGTIIYWLH